MMTSSVPLGPDILTFAYPKSGCTATAMLAARVHGVVVQIRSEALPSFSGNLTITDGSVSSQYSISASARAVSHLGHQVTTLLEGFSRPFSSAFWMVHHADSRYSSLIVWYGLSQSIQTPSCLNCSVMSAWSPRANSLQVVTNLSIPSSSMSFLEWTPICFSTLTSMGRPCMSNPGWSRTLYPRILQYLIRMSFTVLFIAVPRWMAPVVYGGPSTK